MKVSLFSGSATARQRSNRPDRACNPAGAAGGLSQRPLLSRQLKAASEGVAMLGPSRLPWRSAGGETWPNWRQARLLSGWKVIMTDMESATSTFGCRKPPPEAIGVMVAVVSYKRPEGLRRLLVSLAGQHPSAATPYSLGILVVDNDAEQSALAIVEDVRCACAIDIAYVVEARLGIPFARNRALSVAYGKAHWIGFLDDDEWVESDWLAELLKVRLATGADCVWGHVRPVLPPDAPGAFSDRRIFGHVEASDRARVPVAATNNVIFDLAFVKRHGLWFDERLKHSGGSCVRFFRQNARRGMKIHVSKFGVAYEEISRSRLSWWWIIKRQYRAGNSLCRAEILDKGFTTRVMAFVIGLIIIFGSTFPSLLFFVPGVALRARMWLLRGLGVCGAAVGLVIGEYAPKRLESERRLDNALVHEAKGAI